MTVLWIVVLVAAVGVTSLASHRAVGSALEVAEGFNVSPALIGVTILAIGTDLPEIATSLVSSATGHGDVNVGNAMGSAVTQVTLTMGLLCLAGTAMAASPYFVLRVGIATVFAIAMVRFLADDGFLSRADGAILLALWAVVTILLGRGELAPRAIVASGRSQRMRRRVGGTLGWLVVVGAAAFVIVESFLRITEALGVPEFIGSFLALSIGTSLPELFVDWTAIRRGASSMAIGDLFGSSLVDSTLAVGIGPAVFSVAVTSTLFAGTVLAAIGVLAATVVVARSTTYDRRVGVVLLAVYAAVQAITIVLT